MSFMATARELLVMTLELENGETREIRVFEGDDTDEVALRFGEENDLDAEVIKELAENLRLDVRNTLSELESIGNGKLAKSAFQEKRRQSRGDISAKFIQERIEKEMKQIEEQETGRESAEEYEDTKRTYKDELGLFTSASRVMTSGRTNNFDSHRKQKEDNPVFFQKLKSHRSSKSKGKINRIPVSPGNYSTNAEPYLSGLNSSKKSKTSMGKSKAISSCRKLRTRTPSCTSTDNRSQIHERLYAEALEKNITLDKKRYLREQEELQRIADNTIGNGKRYSDDITKRLYYGGLKKEELKERYSKMQKCFEEMGADANLTFTPQISDVSNMIALSKDHRYGRTIEEHLLSEGQRREMKIANAIARKQIIEESEVTGIPQINEISRQIILERSRNDGSFFQDKHNQLYEESFRRIKKKKELQRSVSSKRGQFTPKINAISKRIVKETMNNMSFMERMQKYSNERAEKIRMVENLNESLPIERMIDPDTSRPYFQPATGRSPKSRNKHNLDIGDYLYEESFKSHLKKIKNEQFTRLSDVMQSNGSKINSNSEMIMEEKKMERFKEIFSLLDSDCDGVISPQRVSIENISEECLLTVSPLLIEMEELGLELTSEDFYEALEKLYMSLSIQERNKFLFCDKPIRDKEFDKDLTFQPEINKNTDRLLQSRKRLSYASRPVTTKNNSVFSSQAIEEPFKVENNTVIVNHDAVIYPRKPRSRQRSPVNAKEKEKENHSFKPKINRYAPKFSHYI